MENFEKEINRIKIFIPSFLSSLSTVRAMVRVYLREHRISELDEIQLLSVVDELTTNAVEHAYRYDKGEIKIVLNFYKKTIFLTVEDFGKGYDEKLDSKEDGGFGLSIARKLVDVFEIEKKQKGQFLKLKKELRRQYKMENNFEILERVKDDVQIIEINGELDAFVAPKLKETFNKLIEKDITKYIVDFKGLIHINSLAMGILRGKLQVVREMGGDIKIINLNKHIQTIFETIGLDEIFEIYKNEEEALKSFK